MKVLLCISAFLLVGLIVFAFAYRIKRPYKPTEEELKLLKGDD